jgi:nucleotide-binding universal stress UspA family protein
VTVPGLPVIERILFATDLSESATHAFSYAAAMAAKFGASVTVCYALEDVPEHTAAQLSAYFDPKQWQEILKRNETEVARKIREQVDEFCGEVEKDLPGCNLLLEDVVVRHGKPEERILELEREGNFDLVVLGSHGHGLFAEAMIGSTARRVVRRSKTPVLVIRLPEKE